MADDAQHTPTSSFIIGDRFAGFGIHSDLRIRNDNELLLDHQTGQHVQGMVAVEAAYRAVFSSERYRGIVQAAGDNYITGGNNGLFTKIYTRAPAARSRP